MSCYLWNLSDEFVLDRFDNAIKYFPHNLDFFRWGYWIQRLSVKRTALVMLTTMATIHGNGVLSYHGVFLYIYIYIYIYMFERALDTLLSLSTTRKNMHAHNTQMGRNYSSRSLNFNKI